MAKTDTESALRRASQHVVENLLRVEQLEELIAEAKVNGEDPAVFLSTLSLFREKLAEWRALYEALERPQAALAVEAAE